MLTQCVLSFPCAPVKLKLYRKPGGSAFFPVRQIHVPSLLDVTQTSQTQSMHERTHCFLSHTCFSSFIPNVSITGLSVTQSKTMGSVFDFSSTQPSIYFIVKNWFDLLTPHRSASLLHIFQYYYSSQLLFCLLSTLHHVIRLTFLKCRYVHMPFMFEKLK